MKTLFDTNPKLAYALVNYAKETLDHLPPPPVDHNETASEYFANVTESYEEQCEEAGLDPRNDFNRLSYCQYLAARLARPPGGPKTTMNGILAFYALWMEGAEPFYYDDENYFYLLIGAMCKHISDHREELIIGAFIDLLEEGL
jgi:hypothetical protein